MSVDYDKKYYIGRSEEGKWASVYAYRPKNSSIFLEKGEVFAVISLEGPKGFRAATAGNILLDYLHESYFEADRSSPLLCLEAAITKTASKLGEIVERDTNIGDQGIDLNIVALSIVDKIGYFVSLGKGGVFLSRDDNFVDVTQALKDPTGNKYIKSASTVIEEGDNFILLSPQALTAYTKEEIRNSLNSFDSETLAKKPLENESMLSFIVISPYSEHLHENVVVDPVVETQKVEAMEEQSEETEVLNTEEEDLVSEEKSPVIGDDMDKKEKLGSRITYDIDDEIGSDQDKVPHVPHEPEDHVHGDLEVKYKPTDKVTKFFKQASKKFQKLELGKKIKEKWESLAPEGSDQTTFQYLAANTKSKAQDLWKFLYNLIWIKFLQMDQGMYLKNARRGTNWRLIGTIAVIVVGVIYLFISINTANVERARKIKEAKDTLSSVEEKISEIDPKINSILGVFDTYTRERSTYQSDLSSARDELNSIEVLEEDEETKQTLLSRIDELVARLDRKIVVESPTVLYDFATKVDESVNLTDIEIYDGNVYVSDAGRNAIYTVDYGGGNFAELATGLSSPQSLTINDDAQLIGADRNSTQPFFEVNKASGEIDRFAGLVAEGFDSIIQIDDFKFNDANRIYFVKSDGTPVQYVGEVGAGYAGAYDRFVDTQFSTAKDINVSDGKVYLLMPNEGAVRYYGDQKEQFNLYGLTSSELQNVINSTSFEVTGPFVIYGNSLGRSVVFTTKENGDNPSQSAFVAQIVVGENEKNYLSDIKEIKVDFQTKDIFVLDGTRLLKFEYVPVERLNY